MQEHTTGLHLVSVSFDSSIDDARKAIRHSVTRDPALTRLRELGVTSTGGDVRTSLLDALRKRGVVIERPSDEDAVLKTVQILGADLERVALAEREPIKAAFGKHAELYLVPKEKQELFRQAVGESGLPFMVVLDLKGTVRFAGYPKEDAVSELVEKLVAEAKSDAGAKGDAAATVGSD